MVHSQTTHGFGFLQTCVDPATVFAFGYSLLPSLARNTDGPAANTSQYKLATFYMDWNVNKNGKPIDVINWPRSGKNSRKQKLESKKCLK